MQLQMAAAGEPAAVGAVVELTIHGLDPSCPAGMTVTWSEGWSCEVVYGASCRTPTGGIKRGPGADARDGDRDLLRRDRCRAVRGRAGRSRPDCACGLQQIEVHAKYGGVVPELASRDHIRKLLPLIEEVLEQSQVEPRSIDGIAYTAGPGLVGALLVGAALGRSLAWAWGVPAVGVHHMEGHLLAPLLEDPAPAFPFVALLVSGGHTQLVDVQAIGRYRILGESVDDAAGEAFDKTAKILGLPYPGGPALARLAESGDPSRYRFPRPMTDRPGLDFSFSGLKTFALNAWGQAQSEREDTEQARADIARAFEEAVVDTLLIKCRRAVEAAGVKRLIMAGGVSANRRLRARMDREMGARGVEVFYPRAELCTDNGAMIALAGHERLAAGQHEPLSFGARPRWGLEDLPPLEAASL